MPLKTKTYDLTEEIQRLEEQIDEVDAILKEIDDNGNPQSQAFQGERSGLEAALEGVRWARDDAFDADYAPMWDESVGEITLAGLTAGESAAIEDDLNGGGAGAARIYQVAKGTVDAPYVDDDMSEDERIGAVSQLPDSYVRWAQARTDELSSVSGNGKKSYRELYEESQQDNSNQT
ncbi:hypothetical protein [Natrinema halophilum]|uniref:Uncharacterized protein n=1 Tax=Natrinema halophilum TaxID=1699371 RepID=A0A7D5GLQ2_9EURY|nr:hypothetical protein [Natrinema halophilum]QLG47893.1 hypothetical protein HYG82_03050 [Natrinema halophilum]